MPSNDPSHPDDDDDLRHELRSFGRRRGRVLSGRQKRLWDDVLPRVAVDLRSPAQLPLFGPGQPDAWLEIGFGGGEHLVWQAAHNPRVGIIGCEPFEDGVVKVLTAIEDQALSNVRLHADDARDALRWLPEASIARAFVLFPDPWPKRKHLKRRLVNEHLLQLLARVIRPGGELRLGTDIADYARTMFMSMQHVPAFRWAATGPDDWRIRPNDWPQTRYEDKAVREGRVSSYLIFERV
jgi:tRNA (guanine-N7-)-methyltransferase